MAVKADSYSCDGALSRKLTPYLNNSELSDITIKVGSKLFPAHRLVLAVWSEKLVEMIDSASDSVLELSLDATEREIDIFEKVLRFFYTGEMTFTSDNVKMVMNLADRLELTQLSDMAQKWVGEMIDRGSMVSAVSWLRDAADCNLPSLKDRCFRTLSLYFEYIPEASWLGLSAEEMMGIISQDDIVADDEEAVISRIDAWLKAKGRPEDNQELYREIASKIRLPFLESSALIRLQESSLVVKAAIAANPSLMSEAFKFRALSSELATIPAVYSGAGNNGNENRAECNVLKDMTLMPRLYLKFVPPGERGTNRNAGQAQNKGRFKEMTPDSYNTDMTCASRKPNGSWKISKGSWRFNLKLETKKVKDIEAWCVKYDLKPEVQRYQGSPRLTSYKVVIVTRPSDKDSDLYLADNPVVTVSEGTLEKPADRQSSGNKSIEVTTPPIFAGRKPRAVEVLAVVYCKEHT